MKNNHDFFENINNLIIISKTNMDGEIIYVNDLFCEISGYSKEELLNKPHNIVRHPDMKKEFFKDMWDTIQSGKTWTGKIKNKNKSGIYNITNTIISPILDENNKIKEFMSIRFLITEEENKNISFKKDIKKLLTIYKIENDNFKKHINNNSPLSELNNLINKNNQLFIENKDLKDSFELRLNAKNRKLITEIKMLRNNDLHYQKKVNEMKEDLLLENKKTKEQSEIIEEQNRRIDILFAKIKELDVLSKGRLDLINELEKNIENIKKRIR